MDEQFLKQICLIRSTDSRMSRKAKRCLDFMTDFKPDEIIELDNESFNNIIANTFNCGYCRGREDAGAKNAN